MKNNKATRKMTIIYQTIAYINLSSSYIQHYMKEKDGNRYNLTKKKVVFFLKMN